MKTEQTKLRERIPLDDQELADLCLKRGWIYYVDWFPGDRAVFYSWPYETLLRAWRYLNQ